MSGEPDPNVILLSNRGPVSFVRKKHGFDIKRGAGGLAGALHPVARRLGDKAAWIASAASPVDHDALSAGAVPAATEELGYRLDLLDFDAETYADYYDVVSNRLLWFAHHCLWDEVDPSIKDEDLERAWANYESVNQRFAEKAATVAARGSLVLFQDYHLSIAPALLKESNPEHTILHFTHSSFCGPEGMQNVPEAIVRRVATGMAGADLVGFHVPAWARGYLDLCEQLELDVDHAEATVTIGDQVSHVRCYPIPIDAASLKRRTRRKKVQEWKRRFESAARGPLFVRADRTEPSKNIVRGFEAFGVLLDRRPDLARNARFVACVYPSRQTTPEYRSYSEEIVLAVERVNARHPGAIDLFLEDDFDRTVAALQVYDVLVVNSLMDGMNLVAKEGAAVNERSGTLVLSRSTGAYAELGDHVIEIADPRAIDETAAAMEAAVDLPRPTREERAEHLRAIVTRSTPTKWIEAQLDDLRALRRGDDLTTPPP